MDQALSIERIEVIEQTLLLALKDLQTIKIDMQSERVHAEPAPDAKVAAVRAQVRLDYNLKYGPKSDHQ
ncbi:hypothetical protein [Chitinophaga japonensis]|uniref:Uncharacterized protein n=1 Tax=Chitinophaga japonensis TaxID=104662 RepID=A0A562SYC2_CHIJA|nr:hypothetical protein [Chitinophaga japonensis]TWI86339.1 hypothetical protein LX66_3593 [Chitinophaga japonensis]